MPSKLAVALRIALDNGANLYNAYLHGADLTSLGDWERGPDGYVRKKENEDAND